MQNLFRLDGKIALVTGASKGIGEAMARALAAYGAKVVVSSRNQEAVDAVAASIVADGGDAIGIAAKIGKYPDTHDVVDKTVAHYGGIDIVINNAAVNPIFGPVETTDERATNKIVEVNLHGCLEVAKRALPTMIERGGGSVINISSIGGIKPEPMISMYSAQKAALISLSQSMAIDWGKYNIRVNAVCPGLIKTKFSSALWENDKITQRFLRRVPLGRLGESEDLAGIAVFLSSDAGAYCTGGVYTVDGGYLAM